MNRILARIGLFHLVICAILVGAFVVLMVKTARPAEPCRRTFYIRDASRPQAPVVERSLLVPAVPAAGAKLGEWERYIAKQWGGHHDAQGTLHTARTGERTVDGARIDVEVRRALPGGQSVRTVWEVARAYAWKNAIGRAAQIKGATGADGAGVVLVVTAFTKDEADAVRLARVACEAVGLKLATVDAKGLIRK